MTTQEPRTAEGRALLMSGLTFRSGRRLADAPGLAADIEAEADFGRMALWAPMIVGDVPHGPNGECPEPELCSALIERDLRVRAEAAHDSEAVRLDLYGLREILADLTAGPILNEDYACLFCDVGEGVEPAQHAEGCSWRLANDLCVRLVDAGYVRSLAYYTRPVKGSLP